MVRMPDGLSYVKDNTKIIFSFSNSQRRYCNPDCMAGFIGVLAELKKEVECTGMCFSDATSYPSLSHPNGDSADTEYFTSLIEEQKKVDAFKKFHFVKIYRGDAGWYPSLKNTSYSDGHNNHLHAGEFDNTKIKIINL